ncbi:protein of unknown function [Ralstonia solanacearum CFBP2957]|nr:protein of unknown function [Ralstonia solanacearum CFBP2957]
MREAIAKCKNIWASLPGAGYGQHEHTFEQLRALPTVRRQRGGGVNDGTGNRGGRKGGRCGCAWLGDRTAVSVGQLVAADAVIRQ